MFSNNSPSLSDIAAVTGNNEFGGNNGWWILIILFAIFGGWGNRGGGVNGGVTDGYVLASDFSNIERKIDGVNNGLCDGFYAMNTGMLNGFAGVNTAIANLGFQQQQCCCDNKAMIADLKYTMAMQTNDIMQNCNANYRALHDEIVQGKLEAKDAQIAEQAAKIQALNLAASQAAQNNYIISQLKQAPVPAYTVPNPYTGAYSYNGYACGGCNA